MEVINIASEDDYKDKKNVQYQITGYITITLISKAI